LPQESDWALDACQLVAQDNSRRFTTHAVTMSDGLLKKTRGSTALPILELAGGRILKESLVILHYLADLYPEPPVAQRDPYQRAVGNRLTTLEGEFCVQG
jgi:glutathione S-transferase